MGAGVVKFYWRFANPACIPLPFGHRLAAMPKQPIKVVLVTMFNPGRGRPGELELFRTGLRLRPWKVAGFPAGVLWRNDEGVAALVAGVGPVNTAVQVLSLGLCAPADLRQAYWLVAGIAGGNPAVCSLGSPVFANWVVDGDLAYDLHPADHPPEWLAGLLPLGARQPFGRVEGGAGLFGKPAQVFRLNARLAAWAQRVACRVTLFDSPELAAARRKYAVFPSGALRPKVGRGDVLSAARFWHGARHQAWAERWVKYWTRGRGVLATSTMEDSGTLGALRQLDRLKLADWRRVLVLRSVSNYTLPPPGIPAHQHLLGEQDCGASVNFPGLEAALENLWRSGSAVIRALITRPAR